MSQTYVWMRMMSELILVFLQYMVQPYTVQGFYHRLYIKMDEAIHRPLVAGRSIGTQYPVPSPPIATAQTLHILASFEDSGKLSIFVSGLVLT